MQTPAMPRPDINHFAVKVRGVNTPPVDDGFAIRFDADGNEVCWCTGKDWYDDNPDYIEADTAYVVKYDNTGTPLEVQGYNGYDVTSIAVQLLQSVTIGNAIKVVPSQESPQETVRENIMDITRGFCR